MLKKLFILCVVFSLLISLVIHVVASEGSVECKFELPGGSGHTSSATSEECWCEVASDSESPPTWYGTCDDWVGPEN